VIAIDGPLDIVYGIYQGRPGQPAPLLLARTGWRGFLHEYLPTNIAQLVHLWFHDRAVAQHRKVAPPQLASPPVTVDLTQMTADLYIKNLQDGEERGGRAVSGRLAAEPFQHAL
jgi:hypothetical protein